MIDPDVLEEFKIEADEMLNESEEFLLNLEKGDDFDSSFNGIFRAFHSLKGAAGMFEIDPLQQFMHIVEGQFESLRSSQQMDQNQIDYFLQAVDGARNLINNGSTDFDTSLFDKINDSQEPPKELKDESVNDQKEKAKERADKKARKSAA